MGGSRSFVRAARACPAQALAVLCGVLLAVLAAVLAGAGPADRAAARSRTDPAWSLVVRLAPAEVVGAAERQQAHSEVAEVAAELGLEQRHHLPALDALVFAVPGSTAEAAQRLAAVDGVTQVERDAAVRGHQLVPNDDRWTKQWGLARVNAPEAWSVTTGDSGVTIAILDTGVDAEHADLVANVTGDLIQSLVEPLSEQTGEGANFTDDGAPTDTSDRHGHGTASAGVAAADSDNTEGIAGTCWDCRLLPVKVLGDDGSGAASDVAAGIQYAVDAGVDVISLSLGTDTRTNLLADAVSYAADRDVLVVASAGNFGTEDEVYPAAFADAVGVVASDRDDDRYAFSSFGEWAEIAAPGCNPATDLDGGYKRYCGTSSAAPVVAGAAGLAVSAEDVGADRLRQALQAGTVPFDGAEWGRLDAAATLAALPQTEEPDPGEELDEPDDGDLEDRTEPDDPREEQTSDPGVAQRRISGADRFATAARLSADAFSGESDGLLGGLLGGGGADRVYLTSGLTFADALAAGPAAGTAEAPVLLAARGVLPEPTAAELARLDPDEVVVVGGTGVIGDGVAAAAGEAADADTRRLAGSQRFETAAEVARDAFEAPVEVAYVATGLDYADALAGVPAAVVDGGPMVLTARDQLPDSVAAALSELSPQRIVVLGGTSAVSQAVEAELARFAGSGVERIAGEGRFDTATAVAAERFPTGADSAYLATGFDFPDALAAGPVAGLQGGPLLLVTRDDLPETTRLELERLAPETNVTMGGTEVISEDVQAGASAASAHAGS